ncbi:hypothetical protein COO60DRAFT_1639124 [Scenedesmus sp. NREL 46B-D3]|nr:hypothetical protein COO60DRAFT_1639124 [Scenedesmus sp. NREL 46B-D3]
MKLHRACHNKQLDEVLRLVDAGADISEVEAAGNTPLHSAAYEGWSEGVELLLQLGAKANASNNAGDTPWHWATNMGWDEVASLLERNGATKQKGQVLVPEHVPKVKDFYSKECWAHHPKPYADFMAFKQKERAELEAERKKAQAAAHMVMFNPKSRPWYDYLLNYNYNPHAVFAGGVKSVSKDGQLQWPKRNMYSICGDAAEERKWDKPGQLGGTYKKGQVISTDIVFAQNHLGRVHMRLCPLDAKAVKDCVPLRRPDGKGVTYDLPWTKGWYGVTDGFTPPVSTKNLDFKLSKMQLVGKPQGCAAWSCDQFRGMYVYSFNWQLPKDFTCEKCKLQLYYLTASRCWPPCQKEPCTKPVGYEFCGKPGATYPEEFWNCADVKITS